jgi:2-polyprenyl-3-methyl-5-hydroxy-6-metoxy-1,4-benzoquinol methylase
MTLTPSFRYGSDELDAMACANNYYQWILSCWRPYLAGTVVELGAGIGTFSALLLTTRVERVILVEAAEDLLPRLLRQVGSHPRVTVVRGELHQARRELGSKSTDCVVAVNVLEHIADDVSVIRAAHDLLVPGGIILLFAPALPFLYGSLDSQFGHVRRYTKASLATILYQAQFSIVNLRYVNILGTLPWLLAGRVLRRRRLTPRLVSLTDRTIIRLTALLERKLNPPFGQGVMAVARR